MEGPVPVTIITGALGVGKTTAILDAFARLRPPQERWAVLVNEFGEVGLDGAILSDAEGLAVAEIPGGCICCTAGPMLGRTLSGLIASATPDRLLIEPTGLASPAQILDLLRRPWFEGTVRVQAVITLVDPARFLLPDSEQQETWLAQVEAADVLVANRSDRADADTLDAFRAKAEALWPPKAVVAQTEHGRLESAWLDLSATVRPARRVDHDAGHDHHHDAPPAWVGEHGTARVADDVATAGWVFSPETVFDPTGLHDLLHRLVQPNEALPAGVMRLKAVVHAGNAWGLVQGTGDELAFGPTGHRRDSRIELIVPADPAPDWAKVERWLKDQVRPPREPQETS